MNTAFPTPAKVAPIKARHPKVSEARHPEPEDQPIKKPVDKSVAMMVWACAPLLAILLGYWIAS